MYTKVRVVTLCTHMCNRGRVASLSVCMKSMFNLALVNTLAFLCPTFKYSHLKPCFWPLASATLNFTTDGSLKYCFLV